VIACYLHDNADLRSLGLVQTSWLPSSRRCLFKVVSVNPFSADGFFEVFCAPDCIVASYVRRLELNLLSLWKHSLILLRCDREWLNETLPRLGQLSAVEELAISDLRWDDLTSEAGESLLSVFNNIKQLDIRRSTLIRHVESSKSSHCILALNDYLS